MSVGDDMTCPNIDVFYGFVCADLSKSEEVEFLRHLKTCKKCHEKFVEIETFEADLRRKISKIREIFCPSSDDLYFYFKGQLDEEKNKEIESHVETCSFCQAHLDELKSYSERLEREREKRKPFFEEFAYNASKDFVAEHIPEEKEEFEDIWQNIAKILPFSETRTPREWNLAVRGDEPYGIFGVLPKNLFELKSLKIIIITLSILSEVAGLKEDVKIEKIQSKIKEMSQIFELSEDYKLKLDDYFDKMLKKHG